MVTATLAWLVLCVVPFVATLVLRRAFPVTDCPNGPASCVPDQGWPIALAGMSLELASALTPSWLITQLVALAWLIAVAWWTWRLRHKPPQCTERQGRFVGIAAALAWVAGFGPLVASLAAGGIAGELGCYVTEHGTYSRIDDNHVRQCLLGAIDLGPLLHAAHLSGIFLVASWPLAPVAVLLSVHLAFRRRARVSEAEPGRIK